MAAASLATSPSLSQAEAGSGRVRGAHWPCWAAVGHLSSLWVTQAVPVSFTLAPGPAMEKPPDEVLGLFLHCRFGAGECEGQSPPCRAPQRPPGPAVLALTTPPRTGLLR